MSDISFTFTGFGIRIDGDYGLDWETLTNYEWYVISEVSGAVGQGIMEAMTNGDQRVTLGLAAICLIREGKGTEAQVIKKPNGLIWAAKPGQIMLNVEVEDDELVEETPPSASADGGNRTPSSKTSPGSSGSM